MILRLTLGGKEFILCAEEAGNTVFFDGGGYSTSESIEGTRCRVREKMRIKLSKYSPKELAIFILDLIDLLDIIE